MSELSALCGETDINSAFEKLQLSYKGIMCLQPVLKVPMYLMLVMLGM